jgi:hypothetical protein
MRGSGTDMLVAVVAPKKGLTLGQNLRRLHGQDYLVGPSEKRLIETPSVGEVPIW